MQSTYLVRPSSDLIQKWWLTYSSTACSLPPEYSHAWINLISEVVRHYRLLLHCTHPSDQRFYRKLCLQAMAKSRWELMLTSMYGHLAPQQTQKLEHLQSSLEQSVQN
ncbi:hypothetical protein K8S19_10320 [bacterium]|nr:hypothetical protein [bacterium]